MPLSILPAPPEGLRIIKEEYARQAYIATGFFPPGAARTKSEVEIVPTVVVDADLADYLEAKHPHFLVHALSNDDGWMDDEKAYYFHDLRKLASKLYPDDDFVTAVRLIATGKQRGKVLKAWLHSAASEDFYEDLIVEQRQFILEAVDKYVKQPPTVMTVSGYGHHLLWWLPEGKGRRDDSGIFGASSVDRFNKRLIDTVNKGVKFDLFDRAVSDPGTRLLREIGSANTKGTKRIIVEAVIHEPTRRLNLLRLEQSAITATGAVMNEEAEPVKKHENPAVQRLLEARQIAQREKVLVLQTFKTPDLPPDVVLDYGDGKVTPREWLTEAKDGDSLRVKCPFAQSETVGSAKMFVAGNRVTLCCWAPHHGHAHYENNRALWVWTPGVEPTVQVNNAAGARLSDEEIRASLLERFAVDVKGKIDATSRLNRKLILLEDPAYSGKVWFCERRLQIRIDNADGTSRPAVDDDFYGFLLHCEHRYGMRGGDFQDAVRMFGNVARLNKRNPLKEWLHSLRWDGTHRLDEMLIRVTKCSDTRLHRAYSRRYLISLVARVFEPGCQVDQVLLLTGTQGAGKTAFFRELVTKEWFGNNLMDIQSKDAVLQMAQTWIWEWQENAKRGDEVKAERAFISVQVDNIRPPYGFSVLPVPRHTVFGATSNDNEPLRDTDGTRRWWVVRSADELDLEYLKANREQIFAEAVAAYAAGEIWHIPKGSELDLERVDIAETFKQDDPELEKLVSWTYKDVRARSRLQLSEIAEGCFMLSAAESAKKVNVLGRLLRQAGWVRLKRKRMGTNKIIWWASPMCDGLCQEDFDTVDDYKLWTKSREANKKEEPDKKSNVIQMRKA